MALIVVCGRPSTSKTQHSKELVQFFKNKQDEQIQNLSLEEDKENQNSYSRLKALSILHINEEYFNLLPCNSYRNALEEKTIRGKLLAEVEKNLSPNTIIICDALNYIKGFRYELFCRARTTKTPYCMIYCDTPKDVAKEWNLKRKKEEQWTEDLLEDLSSRFEVPNSKNKWDRPSFTLNPNDNLPGEEIFLCLFEAPEKHTRNSATEYKKMEATNYLFEMDQKAQAIINRILETQNSGLLGEVVVPGCTRTVQLKRRVTIVELSKLRRQFIKLNSQSVNAMIEENTAGDSFIVYLNSVLNS